MGSCRGLLKPYTPVRLCSLYGWPSCGHEKDVSQYHGVLHTCTATQQPPRQCARASCGWYMRRTLATTMGWHRRIGPLNNQRNAARARYMHAPRVSVSRTSFTTMGSGTRQRPLHNRHTADARACYMRAPRVSARRTSFTTTGSGTRRRPLNIKHTTSAPVLAECVSLVQTPRWAHPTNTREDV